MVKILCVLTLIGLGVTSSTSIAEEIRIPGCEDIDTISSVITTLWPSWDSISRNKIKDTWHLDFVENGDTNQSAERKFVSLTHEGRFTDWCECCYTFNFHLTPLKDSSYQDQIESITIFHTEATFDETVTSTRKLLSAIRASEQGNDPNVSDWSLDTKDMLVRIIWWNTKQSAESFIANAVNLQIYRSGKDWTLYMNLSKQKVDLPKQGD